MSSQHFIDHGREAERTAGLERGSQIMHASLRKQWFPAYYYHSPMRWIQLDPTSGVLCGLTEILLYKLQFFIQVWVMIKKGVCFH